MFLAALCFQAAYVSIHFPAAGFLIFGYAFFLVRLTNQSTVRQAFYFGLATGFLCYAPQLFFFWHIFSAAAVVLWLILAAWLGLFAAICCGCLRGGLPDKIMWLIPIVWTGLEYFRSELYYLKFSWMNAGYALPPGLNVIGIIYFNTAFVVDPNGDVVFKQAKSVPVQFFQDGLPARKQAVWESPWGRIGVCICYDLSYTRVTDSLVSQGAQLLIVPTMDVSEWGRHQHELHSRVAPVRAAEYDIPIFRVASSGISQAVQANGYVTAQTHVGGIDEVLSAELTLAKHPRMPWDRVLAPLCLGFTIVILVLRLLVTVKTIIAGRRARALAQPKT